MTHASGELFHDIDESRVPVRYLANLFGAGEERQVRYALRKQKAVRWWRRFRTVGDVEEETALRMLAEADCTPEQADAIYKLTALCSFEDRFVIPPMHREEAIQMLEDPRGGAGRHRLRVQLGHGEVDMKALLEELAELLRYPRQDYGFRLAVAAWLSRGEPCHAALREARRADWRPSAVGVAGALHAHFRFEPGVRRWRLAGSSTAEGYARGSFLAYLRQALSELGIGERGELPDHLSNVLAAIARMPDEKAGELREGRRCPRSRRCCGRSRQVQPL
ncbi:MAG: hypothetical protein R2748_22020 [Bryobacterales bacterium]